MKLKSFRILFLIAVSFVVGCSHVIHHKAILKKYLESRPFMGTIVHVTICYSKDQKNILDEALSQAWSRFEDLDWRLSDFDEKSDVKRINSSRGQVVAVSPDTFHLLKESVRYNSLTQNIFDITVGGLMQLWKMSEERNQLPSQEELEKAKSTLGSFNIEFLPDYKIRLLNKDTKITLAGIVPGFVVDQAVGVLRNNGFQNFLIDGGGELYASGLNCEGQPWRIGIRDPRDLNRLIDLVEITNRAVSTSGDYAKYYEIQGQRWSRIINPITGYPQRNVTSATVIASTATEADAISTALTILGGKRGVALVDSLADHPSAVIFETSDQKSLIQFQNSRYLQLRKTSKKF